MRCQQARSQLVPFLAIERINCGPSTFRHDVKEAPWRALIVDRDCAQLLPDEPSDNINERTVVLTRDYRVDHSPVNTRVRA
jgi:hypothetical protein